MLNSLFHPPPDGGKSVTACLSKYPRIPKYTKRKVLRKKLENAATGKYIYVFSAIHVVHFLHIKEKKTTFLSSFFFFFSFLVQLILEEHLINPISECFFQADVFCHEAVPILALYIHDLKG